MNEIIYLLTNEAMPGYVKVGRTKNLEQRRPSLSRPSSVPLPFEVYYASEVDNAQRDEQWIHSVFADRRVRDEREFFKIDPERIVAALKRIEKRDITPKSLQHSLASSTEEEKKEVEEKKKIRSKFDFKKYGVPIGSEITFSRNPSIKAEVLPNNKIKLNGKEKSLSKSAQELLGYNYSVAGTLYWIYEDESLDERRRRFESGK
jgi:hypothetical protein